MSEETVVRLCAPTLAGLKTATLFAAAYQSPVEVRRQVRCLNRVLVPKGLRAVPLMYGKRRVQIYVYRPDNLRRDLQNAQAQSILRELGYAGMEPAECICRLRHQLRDSEEYPHEIGLFLGYPLGDVEGFIRNRGQNCKCAGCWKVYCNELEAQKRFARIQKCRKVYARLWAQGRSVWQLTVAA